MAYRVEYPRCPFCRGAILELEPIRTPTIACPHCEHQYQPDVRIVAKSWADSFFKWIFLLIFVCVVVVHAVVVQSLPFGRVGQLAMDAVIALPLAKLATYPFGLVKALRWRTSVRGRFGA